MQPAPRHMAITIFMTALATLVAAPMVAQSSTPKPTKDRARVLLSQPLPKLSGDSLKVILVEVHYGPGEVSPPHSHPCAVVGYVVQGAIRTQAAGRAETIYRVGQTFYELPNTLHSISANASTTEPATFVAYFVCDREGPLSVNLPQTPDSKEVQP